MKHLIIISENKKEEIDVTQITDNYEVSLKHTRFFPLILE